MMTLRDLFARLHTEGSLPAIPVLPDAEEADPDDPWYLRALIGVGAWIAAVLFLAFLFSFDVFDSAVRSLVLGVGLMAVAFGLRLKTEGVFGHQLAFALSLAGQAAFLGGVAQAWEFDSGVFWLVGLGLEAGLLLFYPDAFHRLLSVLLAVGAAVGLVHAWEVPNFLHLIVALLTAGTAVLWLRESRFMAGEHAAVLRPLGYGLALALFGTLVLLLFDDKVSYPWISTLAVGAGLLGVVGYVLREHGVEPGSMAMVLGGSTVLLLLTLQAPGIAAALLVIVLGVHRGNPLLFGLAVAFLAVFIILFYYEMDVTLLAKSGMLVGSGAVLLVLRWFWMRRVTAHA